RVPCFGQKSADFGQNLQNSPHAVKKFGKESDGGPSRDNGPMMYSVCFLTRRTLCETNLDTVLRNVSWRLSSCCSRPRFCGLHRLIAISLNTRRALVLPLPSRAICWSSHGAAKGAKSCACALRSKAASLRFEICRYASR